MAFPYTYRFGGTDVSDLGFHAGLLTFDKEDNIICRFYFLVGRLKSLALEAGVVNSEGIYHRSV